VSSIHVHTWIHVVPALFLNPSTQASKQASKAGTTWVQINVQTPVSYVEGKKKPDQKNHLRWPSIASCKLAKSRSQKKTLSLSLSINGHVTIIRFQETRALFRRGRIMTWQKKSWSTFRARKVILQVTNTRQNAADKLRNRVGSRLPTIVDSTPPIG